MKGAARPHLQEHHRSAGFKSAGGRPIFGFPPGARERPMSDQLQTPAEKDPHGHVGPATPAEDVSRSADPAVVPPKDKARIAEEASREEDA
jgi:hypothetical protein